MKTALGLAVAGVLASATAMAAPVFSDSFGSAAAADTSLTADVGLWTASTGTGSFAPVAVGGTVPQFASGNTGNGYVRGYITYNGRSTSRLDSGVISFDVYMPSASDTVFRIQPISINGSTIARIGDAAGMNRNTPNTAGVFSNGMTGAFTRDAAHHIDMYFNSTLAAMSITVDSTQYTLPAGEMLFFYDNANRTNGTKTIAAPVDGVQLFSASTQGAYGTEFYVDNIAVQAIPEPAALGLLGLSGLLLRRRK